jgi:hypothetical protein
MSEKINIKSILSICRDLEQSKNMWITLKYDGYKVRIFPGSQFLTIKPKFWRYVISLPVKSLTLIDKKLKGEIEGDSVTMNCKKIEMSLSNKIVWIKKVSFPLYLMPDYIDIIDLHPPSPVWWG